MDLVLREPGAPLAEGGGILEINVPSGFWYVRDPDAVARAELDAVAAHDADFAAHGGRVPFWVVPVPERGMSVPDAIRRRFAAEHPGGAEVSLMESEDGRDPWPAVLTRDADALLLPLSEQEVQRYGLPMHLAPTVWVLGHDAAGESAPLSRTHPLLAAVLARAGLGVREVST